MPSSQPFIPSSQLSLTVGGALQQSQFTFKHLSQLASSSTTCPLRVIAHIDLDAFYAQCEMIRLGLPEDQPLAVQQWQGLIAINYPARKYGMDRHINIHEARKLCPEIVLQHVATWKEGEELWRYHDDAFTNMGTHKVSLDPYRLQSRKILECIKAKLPASPLQRVEKASIDEVFLDLSAHVHSILLERYSELKGPAPYDDPTEYLPSPPSTALDWDTDALVDLDNNATEYDDPDWDDVCMLIGSEIIRSLRGSIREELKYTCSAGVARNKMLAKLGSGHKKPNQQTIIRNRAIHQFLEGFKYTKIRNLGGKLGDEVVAAFGTEEVKELLRVPLEALQRNIGDDTGAWLYRTIRGEDHSEVNSRTQIKSMLSAKSFRPSINSYEQAIKWICIFTADIFSRLVEEGVLEHRRRPRNMNLHYRQGLLTRSKSISIPTGKTIDKMSLLGLAKTLLGQVIVEGRAWPCSNLSLSVSSFEDGVSGNKGIGTFLLKGEDAKAVNAGQVANDHSSVLNGSRPEKRRRIEGSNIKSFLTKKEDGQDEHGEYKDNIPVLHHTDVSKEDELEDESLLLSENEDDQRQLNLSEPYLCSKCSNTITLGGRAEHEDWHFAKELQESERPSSVAPLISRTPAKKPAPSKVGRPKKADRRLTAEKGQAKLNFRG